MHRTKDNFNYLTTAPVPKVIMTLAAPTIVSMLVTSFYNIADTYFVGKINTRSTAAVGIVFSVMSIIQAVGFSLGMVPEITSLASWELKKMKLPERWPQPDFSWHCRWV